MLPSVKNSQVACIAALFLCWLVPFSVLADFNCSSDVSYKWTGAHSDPGVTGTAKAETTPTSDAGAVSQTFVGKIEAHAESEELAKKALEERASAAKTQAISRCKREHENMSGCVAAKYSAMGTTLNTLTFSARKALEDAIQTDCDLQRGTCVEAIISEAQCREQVKAVEPTPEAAKGADKKADKKK